MRELSEHELPDDDEGPSRSQLKRDAQASFDLARELVELAPHALERVPLPDEIRALIAASRRITQQIARKRQLQFLAKQMRKLDCDFETIRQTLQPDKEAHRRETARLHRLESWRETLLGNDSALTQLLESHHEVDRQHLRQLIRSAQRERLENRPQHSYREIFQILRELDDSAPLPAPPPVEP
jgi:ribosome-associated protein